MENVLMLAVGAGLGALAGFMAARLRAPVAAGVIQREVEDLRVRLAVAETRIGAEEAAHAAARADRERLSAELRQTAETAAGLQAEKTAQEERMKAHEAAVAAMQAENRAQFENLANAVLKSTREEFAKESQKNIGELLNPLKKDFGEFRKTVDESFGAHFRTQSTLKEEIQKIVLQADGLTKALKGDSKTQGNWGEVILERILEDAGLQNGREYTLQGAEMGLKHVEHGGNLKPDVVVNLPEGKHIIIDSKVSLTHYERFCSESGEAERAALLKQYLQSVRAHVNELEQRRYQDSHKLGTPDFVLMFLPIEAAYALAVQQDRELHGFAWSKRVVMVCPSTLFATLRTVASLWKIELQNRNAQEIARQGGALYDKIAGFIADMEAVDTQLGRARNVFEAAKNKLYDGHGNLLSRAERLKELGAKTSKSLPRELLTAAAPETKEAEEEAA